jgi:hypothetical protein
METDYSGCTKYGAATLTGLYRKLLRFQKMYPQAYRTEAALESEAILEKFNDDPYPCETREGVLHEYRLFVKTFPKDRNTPGIRTRLKKIELNKMLGVRQNLRATILLTPSRVDQRGILCPAAVE